MSEPLPAIQSVSCFNDVVIVELSMMPTTPITGAIFKGNPSGTEWVASAFNIGNISIPVGISRLDPTFQYTVAIAFRDSVPAWGPSEILVFQHPTLSAVLCAPELIKVAWTVPLTNNLSAVNAVLYDVVKDTLIAQELSTGSGAQLRPAVPLDPAGSYVIYLKGVNGLSSGPIVFSTQLLLTAPAIAQVVCAPMAASRAWKVTVTPLAVASPPESIVVGRLFADGTLVAEAIGDNDCVVIPSEQPLDPASRWEVAILYRSALGIDSPVSAATKIPTEIPVLTHAVFDGTVFRLSWTPPSGVPGAVVSLRRVEDGVEIGSANVPSGASATITPSVAVNPAKQYQALFAPLAGRAQGAFGTGVALIVTPPSLNSVSTDGTDVAVILAGIASGTSMLTLSSGGADVISTVAGRFGGFLRLPSVGLDNPVVTARASMGNILGPPSAATPIVLSTPAISRLNFGAGIVTGSVIAPAGLPLTNPMIQVSLYAEGIPAGVPVDANADGSFSIPAPAFAKTGLTVRAAVRGSAQGVAVAAPLSPPVSILSVAPAFVCSTLLQSATGQWQIEAEWSMEGCAQAASFRVSLQQSGSELQAWTIMESSFSAPAPAFSAANVLTLTVTPQGNFGTGPASEPATFAPMPITLSAAWSDGVSVAAQWAALPGVRASGYRLRLVESVDSVWLTVAQSEVVEGVMAVFSLPAAGLDLSKVYGITVDLLIGSAWSAANETSILPMQPPLITSATILSGTSVSLVWSAPAIPASSITHYQPVLQWSGGEMSLANLPASPTTARLAIPPAVPNNASITLRAIAGPAVGPLAAAAPLLLDSPTGLQVAYDGATLSATWDKSTDSRIGGYVVTVWTNDQPQIETVTTNSYQQALLPPGAGATVLLAVALQAGSSTGQFVAAVSAVLAAPVIQTTAYDGETLQMSWPAVVGATAYRVDVLSGGAVCQSVIAGGTSAAISLRQGSFSVQVRAMAAAALGPPSSPPVTPLLTPPLMIAAGLDASTGALSASWSLVPGAVAYTVELYNGSGTPIRQKVSTTSFTLPASSLPAPGCCTLRVQPAASAMDDQNTGPWSRPAPVLLLAPLAVAVEYNGREARVSWQPVAARDVSGYQVSLLGLASVQVAFTEATELVLSVPFDKSQSPMAVVQAMTGYGAGQPSAQTPLFRAGWYVSANAPYLQPATVPAMEPYDIVLSLPNIFTTSVQNGLPSSSPFVFAVGRAPFTYTLTMPYDSIVWTFAADPIRAGVWKAYNALLAALTQLGLTSFGWRVVQDAISRSMPQTFAETLLYGCGLVSANGYIDLKPGMILRAEYQSYQYLGPGQANAAELDGYVAANSAEYEVTSYVDPNGAALLTGFDAFLARITAAGSIVPTPQLSPSGAVVGGGGVIDTFFSQFRLPYCRLVYPPSFLASTDSNPRSGYNVALLSAVDYPTLNTATQQLRNLEPLGSGAAVLYLRGRTVLTAAIRIWVDGSPLTVPVGFTVANVLDSLARRPPVTPNLPISGLRLTRSIGAAITPAIAGEGQYPVASGMPVYLDWAGGTAYDPLTDWLALPLLPGDRLDIGREA